MTQARLLQTLVFVTLGIFVFITGGCSQGTAPKSPSDTSPTSRPADPATVGKPASVSATPHDQVPIVYDERLSPNSLSQTQIDDILQYAEPLTPAGRRVWYIHVMHNFLRECQVLVYYTPDVVAGRIRKGKFVGCYPAFDEILKKLKDTSPRENECLGQYVQVSMADQPFGTELDAPTKTLWPFHQPESFSDEDIIELVDLARKGVDNSDWSLNGSRNQPVYQILREDGKVMIMTGSSQGPLAGEGDVFTCIKREGRWVIISAGFWES